MRFVHDEAASGRCYERQRASKTKDSEPSSRAPPIQCKHVGAPAMPNPARTRARQMVIEHARLMPALDAHATLPREEVAIAGGERAGGRCQRAVA